MTLPFTSVVSYHTNPMTCGVAKFSKLLADRLGVPFVGLDDTWGLHPLLSIKWSEIDDEIAVYERTTDHGALYGLFWHDFGSQWMTERASVVFYADPSLGSPGLWCPSLLTPSKPRTVQLFSFGMAHKLQTQHYRMVRELLDAAGLRYHLRVSVGLHEGTSLADATQHFDALYEIMGRDNVTILGILSDDAVADELQSADFVLAFFEQGLRANNTTVHAALETRRPVVTNHDQHTPEFLQYVTMNIDGTSFGAWLRNEVHPYSWDKLILQMEAIYAKSLHRQPAHQR